MHITGKILVWVVAVCALGAVVLVGRLYDVQNSWAGRAARLKQENEDKAAEIARLTATRDRLRLEFDREMENWGGYQRENPSGYWNDVQTRVAPDGQVRAQGLGRNRGFGFPAPDDRPELPVAYAFQIEPDGTSSYVGAFQAAQLREDESELIPTFQAWEGEAQEWARSQTWRFRRQVPAPLKNRVSDVRSMVLLASDRLTEQERHLAEQTRLEEAVREHLEGRRRELLGAEGRPGLVAQIESEEEARNAALEELDRLRRQVKATYDGIRQGIEKNGRLARSLAPPTDRAAAR